MTCSAIRRFFVLMLAGVASMCVAGGAAHATVVAYYTFDGADATDASGFGNTGVVGGAVSFVSDVPSPLGGGMSASFDGTGGYAGLISVANSASLEALDNSITVAFWIKMEHTDNSNWIRVMRKASEGAGTDGWIINRNSANSDLLMRTDTTGGGGAFNQNRGQGVGVGMLDGEWHHYAHVRSNGTWIEYVDGVQTGTGAYPHGNGFGNAQPLLIGGRGQNMIGQLDEVLIWDGVLDSRRVGLLADGISANALIPEPITATLLSLAIAPLALRRRRVA